MASDLAKSTKGITTMALAPIVNKFQDETAKSAVSLLRSGNANYEKLNKAALKELTSVTLTAEELTKLSEATGKSADDLLSVHEAAVTAANASWDKVTLDMPIHMQAAFTTLENSITTDLLSPEQWAAFSGYFTELWERYGAESANKFAAVFTSMGEASDDVIVAI